MQSCPISFAQLRTDLCTPCMAQSAYFSHRSSVLTFWLKCVHANEILGFSNFNFNWSETNAILPHLLCVVVYRPVHLLYGPICIFQSQLICSYILVKMCAC